LKNEGRNFFKEIKQQRECEKTFSELPARELEQLFVTDDYFSVEQIINVLSYDVVMYNTDIAETLQSLTECKRYIILLSYFLEMTDREGGNVTVAKGG